MTKQEARERMKVLRRELSGTERDEKSRAAANHLFRLPAMKQASYFFPFVKVNRSFAVTSKLFISADALLFYANC